VFGLLVVVNSVASLLNANDKGQLFRVRRITTLINRAFIEAGREAADQAAN